MNKFNPSKLLNSKWTAIKPMNKEKHFLISDVEFNEDGLVISCKTEAIMSNNEYEIDWADLKDQTKWIQGWK